MYTEVETFRSKANAYRLEAELVSAHIPCRVRSIGNGATWSVFVRAEDHDMAYNIATGVIYV